MVEFAWTEAHTPLSTEELEAQIKGATRAGQYSKGTYYITFRDNGNYGVNLDSKEGLYIERVLMARGQCGLSGISSKRGILLERYENC
jgi:hypothetical protein